MEIKESHAGRKASWLDIVVAWALVGALYGSLILYQIWYSDPL